MEYRELIVAVATETNYTPREIRKLLRIVARIIRDTAALGLDSYIQGLGRFKNVVAKARTARNPRTRQPMPIPARRRLRFLPSADLKDAVHRSNAVFEMVDLRHRYGLDKPPPEKKPEKKTRMMDVLIGARRGKVRRTDRPGEGSQGEEGRTRGPGSASEHEHPAGSGQGQ